MPNRDLNIRIDGDPSGFDRAAKSARASAAVFERELKKVEAQQAKVHAAMDQVGKVVLGAGAAMAAGIGLAVAKFADFDAAMSKIEAATMASAGEMNKLREAALEAGARTVFSATEAADAIEQLAKAGVSTADILGGGLNGALDLAAAGSLAVGEAAEIAATAMTQFSLSGDQIPHVADLLAAAAGKAQGEVTDMGMALKQSGLVAAQMGVSIEETTGTLASFASAGLLGSDAGTSFRTMLLRLANPSEKAAGAMKDIGLQAYDAQGNFVGMESVAGQLAEGLGGVDQATRDAALATIFGSDAIRAANVLYKQGASGIAEWTDKVDQAGYAQEVAATKLDNLKGDFEALVGSVETALIKTGSAGNGLARGLVQQATDIVNAYNSLPPAAQAAVLGVGGVTSALLLAGGGFLMLAPRIVETKKALSTLAETAPKTTGAMVGLSKALAIGTVATVAALGIDQLIMSTVDAPPSVAKLTEGLADFASRGRATGELARMLGDDFAGLSETLSVANQNKAASLFDFGTSVLDIEEARAEIDALDQALARLVASGNGDDAARFLREAGVSAADAKEHFTAYTGAQDEASASAKLSGSAQEQMAAAVEGATGAIDEQEVSLTELMEAAQNASNAILGLRGNARDYEEAVDAASKALKENGRTLDINTEKGRANEAALDAIASSAGDVLTSMVETGRPISDVTAKFGQQRDALIKAAQSFGMTRTQAIAYADSVLRIPDKKSTTIVLTGAEAAMGQVARLRDYLAGLKNKSVTVRVDEVLGVTVQRGSFAGRNVEKHAAGGAVLGEGTGTSDSIPALLSNGEHVWTAREVIAAGGHAAVERMRRAVQGFARGGRVQAFATGGRVSATDARSLTGAARGLTSVEQIRALVTAWEAYNEQLEQAARRQELFNTLAQAMADRKVAKGTEQIAQTTREVNDARKALSDFDFAAARDRESAAVQRQIDALEDQAEATKKAADAEADLTEKLKREYDERVEALADLAEAAADAQDRTVDRLNDLLDQQDAVRGRQVQSERDYALQVQQIRAEQAAAEQGLARDTAAARQALMLEQERILGARRTQLASWARLDEQVGAGWGNTVEQLLLNARAQARQFEEWMGELATARARGVSEDVLTALGLDEGPQALGQLRQFNAATVDEVQALNAEVARRTTLAGQQTSREQQAQLGALGRELLAAQERYVDTLTELQARFVEEQAALDEQLTAAQTEFVVEQAEFATELAAIGQEQGRSYSEGIAAAITSGIPGIVAAAEAARAATVSLAAAQAALAAAQTAAPTTAGAAGSGGILDSPFKRGGILNGTARPEVVLGPGMSAGPQTVNVQVFVGDREITDIVDVRLSNRLTAQQTAHQVAGARG